MIFKKTHHQNIWVRKSDPIAHAISCPSNKPVENCMCHTHTYADTDSFRVPSHLFAVRWMDCCGMRLRLSLEDFETVYIAVKWERSYCEVKGWVRARLVLAVLQSSIMCLRGASTKWRRLGLKDRWRTKFIYVTWHSRNWVATTIIIAIVIALKIILNDPFKIFIYPHTVLQLCLYTLYTFVYLVFLCIPFYTLYTLSISDTKCTSSCCTHIIIIKQQPQCSFRKPHNLPNLLLFFSFSKIYFWQ